MARIRTVKPSFLRHEKLQDLEAENPNQYVMMVFMGLWMLADNKGRFEYKPRSMKLDILPFLDYSIQASLDTLEAAEFIETYYVDGQKYGLIPTFKDHQRITGKEAQDGERFPAKPTLNADSQRGITGEAPEKQLGAQEGKGKEEEREGNKEGEGNGQLIPSSSENILIDKILKNFNFNEVTNFDKLRDTSNFLRCIAIADRVQYFESQMDAYFDYKKLTNGLDFIHSFKNFLGSHDKLFTDGAWNQENWVAKLETEKLTKQNGKANQSNLGRRSHINPPTNSYSKL